MGNGALDISEISGEKNFELDRSRTLDAKRTGNSPVGYGSAGKGSDEYDGTVTGAAQGAEVSDASRRTDPRRSRRVDDTNGILQEHRRDITTAQQELGELIDGLTLDEVECFAPDGWIGAVKSLRKQWGMHEDEFQHMLDNNKLYTPPPSQSSPSSGIAFVNNIVIGLVGSVGHFIIGGLNTLHTYDIHHLRSALDNRAENQPLITVSNHRSVFDDPFLLGAILPYNVLFNSSQMRWGLCGVDICFRNRFYGTFLTLGHTLPIIRNGGLDQAPLYQAVEKLKQGKWLHIYPEGRVHQRGIGYFKRGIGKMIMLHYHSLAERIQEERKGLPVVLPIYHEGMEKVMPQDPMTNVLKSKIPRVGKEMYLMVGEPINMEGMVKEMAKRCRGLREAMEDTPECLRVYEEIADRLAHCVRLLRAKLRMKVRNEQGERVLGEPFEIS